MKEGKKSLIAEYVTDQLTSKLYELKKKTKILEKIKKRFANV